MTIIKLVREIQHLLLLNTFISGKNSRNTSDLTDSFKATSFTYAYETRADEKGK